MHNRTDLLTVLSVSQAIDELRDIVWDDGPDDPDPKLLVKAFKVLRKKIDPVLDIVYNNRPHAILAADAWEDFRCLFDYAYAAGMLTAV